MQKSRSSTSSIVTFTLNVGICSAMLREKFGVGSLSGKPTIEDCHWRQRIGFLLPQKQDQWWTLDDQTRLENVSAEIVGIVQTVAVPVIQSHISDEQLKEAMFIGDAAGSTELQRYEYLTTLMKLTKDERFEETLTDLLMAAKGKPWERTAKIHISELESYG